MGKKYTLYGRRGDQIKFLRKMYPQLRGDVDEDKKIRFVGMSQGESQSSCRHWNLILPFRGVGTERRG